MPDPLLDRVSGERHTKPEIAMKTPRRFKIVTVAGVYFPIGSLNGFVTEPDIAFYREGSRRWDTRRIRRAAKRGRRTAAIRRALAEARA